jgi:hypothetical protein
MLRRAVIGQFRSFVEARWSGRKAAIGRNQHTERRSIHAGMIRSFPVVSVPGLQASIPPERDVVGERPESRW